MGAIVVTASGALVLVSGGIDSAVALYWALRGGGPVSALTFDYPTRPAREVEATLALCRAAGVTDVHRVSLPWMAEAADLPPALARNPALARAPQGYVPSRNLAFYGIASYYAESLGVRHIVGGHNGADAETFPDASPPFFRALGDTMALGAFTFAERPFEVVLPLRHLDKRDVLELGFELGVPFETTWSCYWNDRRDPCGECASCSERAGAFAAVGRPDPLVA